MAILLSNFMNTNGNDELTGPVRASGVLMLAAGHNRVGEEKDDGNSTIGKIKKR